jgi:hypothetical protein
MALHRLTSVTMGVPNVDETAAYYADFGLQPGGVAGTGSGRETWFSTRDGGRQLRIVPAPTRRLVDLHVGVDDVGRGAHAMLEDHPERHVWGLGRHYGGSNFFWYLKDPAGNFSEYYSDMDCIVDDQLWTPEDLEGARGLFSWGPPPPPSFLHPDDLAAMMTGAHSGR